ncbi:hypothetical protein D3C86_1418730 [compost metagenome]
MQEYPNYNPAETTEQANGLQEPEVNYMMWQLSNTFRTTAVQNVPSLENTQPLFF